MWREDKSSSLPLDVMAHGNVSRHIVSAFGIINNELPSSLTVSSNTHLSIVIFTHELSTL